MKKDRLTTSDEARERQLILEQIERAAADSTASQTNDDAAKEEGLKRDESSEKVVLSFTAKPAAPVATTSLQPQSAPLKMNAFKAAKANPLKANPLKANPLKRKAPEMGTKMSAAERLILE